MYGFLLSLRCDTLQGDLDARISMFFVSWTTARSFSLIAGTACSGGNAGSGGNPGRGPSLVNVELGPFTYTKPLMPGNLFVVITNQAGEVAQTLNDADIQTLESDFVSGTNMASATASLTPGVYVVSLIFTPVVVGESPITLEQYTITVEEDGTVTVHAPETGVAGI